MARIQLLKHATSSCSKYPSPGVFAAVFPHERALVLKLGYPTQMYEVLHVFRHDSHQDFDFDSFDGLLATDDCKIFASGSHRDHDPSSHHGSQLRLALAQSHDRDLARNALPCRRDCLGCCSRSWKSTYFLPRRRSSWSKSYPQGEHGLGNCFTQDGSSAFSRLSHQSDDSRRCERDCRCLLYFTGNRSYLVYRGLAADGPGIAATNRI